MIRCVAMLTHNDITVPNALEVFEQNKHAKAEYWGFKDVGVTLDKWADLAIKYQIDGVLGYFFPSVSAKLKAAGILSFPPFGGRNDEMRLVGTIEELTKAAMEIIEAGSSGIRMSAYRWVEGNPEELAAALKLKFDAAGIPFMMTGSVNDFGKLDVIKQMQPWGITVGGALFEDGKFGGGTVAERIDRIDQYCNEQ